MQNTYSIVAEIKRELIEKQRELKFEQSNQEETVTPLTLCEANVF